MPKKKQDLLDRLISSISVRGLLFHPASLFIAATAGLVVGAIWLWEAEHEKIGILPQFQLTKDNVRLTPKPDWAEGDLKGLVLGNDQNPPRSILEPHLVPEAAEKMKAIGYVERVQSVRKSKTGLDIELVYRQPVGRVELSPITIPEWANSNSEHRLLLPVDRQGVVMPEKLASNDDIPKIMIPYPAAADDVSIWSRWPDERINDAASICELFRESAKTMGLALVVQDPIRHAGDEIPFDLRFESGVIIIWGSAPGKELETEADSDAKLQAIQQVVDEYGPEIALGKKVIDVRSGNAVIANETKTASILDRAFEVN